MNHRLLESARNMVAAFGKIAVLASLVATGCGVVVAAGTGHTGAPLAGTSWRLIEFQSMDDAIGTTRPDDPSLYTMRFNNDGTVSMRLNCNRAHGSWQTQPGSDGSSGSLTFGPLAMTRALCPPPSMDEMIAANSAFVRGYLLKDDRLYLSLMADGGIFAWELEGGGLGFTAADAPATADQGEPRNWEVVVSDGGLNLRDTPSPRAGILTSYPNGTILDNLGCKDVSGQVWCDVQQLGGGERGYVSKTYLRPAVSPDGSVHRGTDDSALRAGRGEFDATGSIPCGLDSGQPMSQCTYGVARAGGGYATVVVTRPDGRTRAIYFRLGKPIGADTSQADGYPAFRSEKQDDRNLIEVGTERYEIPDAVVLGG